MYTALRVENFLGVAAAELEFGEGLNLVVGPTGAGKTAVADAIRICLGALPRIKLKKHGHLLMRAGQKRGLIALDHPEGRISVRLPTLVAEHRPEPSLIEQLLTSQEMLLSAGPAERIKMLQQATGGGGAERVIEWLRSRHKAEYVTTIAPMLTSSLEAARERAKAKAAECRAEWKGVTGETYGHNKAAGWRPDEMAGAPSQEEVQARIDERAEVRAALAQVQSQIVLGKQAAEAAKRPRFSVEALRQRLLVSQSEVDAKSKLASNLQARRLELETARNSLACPGCGLALRLDDAGKLAEVKAGKRPTHDEVAQAQLKAAQAVQAKRIAEQELEKARAELDLAEAEGETPPVISVSLSELEADREHFQAREEALNVEIDQMRQHASAAARLSTAAKAAASAHERVEQWVRLAEDLSDSGPAGALYSSAVSDFLMAMGLVMAEDLGIEAGEDMEFAHAGIPYELCSRGQRLRTQIAALCALASFAPEGRRTVVIDDLDALSPAARNQALSWMHRACELHDIQAIAMMAADKMPAVPASVKVMTIGG